MPSPPDRPAEGLAGLLDEGGPPATREGLAAVRLRHHRLARRRLRALSAGATAAAVAMAGVGFAGTGGPGPAARRSGAGSSVHQPVAAPAQRSAASAAALPAAASPAGGSLHLAFLATLAGADVRAYVAGPVVAPSAATPGGTGVASGSGGAVTSCRPMGRLVVEISSRLVAGRVVVEAPPAEPGGFAAARLQVVGAAEGAPLEVVVARAPVAAARVTVRFAGGRVESVPVHGGLAVAVERGAGNRSEGAVLVAVGAGGKELATLRVRPGRPGPAGCGRR